MNCHKEMWQKYCEWKLDYNTSDLFFLFHSLILNFDIEQLRCISFFWFFSNKISPLIIFIFSVILFLGCIKFSPWQNEWIKFFIAYYIFLSSQHLSYILTYFPLNFEISLLIWCNWLVMYEFSFRFPLPSKM